MADPSEIVRFAEEHMGCPYVYGAWGQSCTPSMRKRYAAYNPDKSEKTYERCPVLSGKQSACTGCQYDGKQAFDCRGFTHAALETVGIEITGGYVGRQWTENNWDAKGTIDQLPDLVCCLFINKDGKWTHTGLHVGGGNVIHCSGEVKRDKVGGDRNWSHWGVPKGLYTPEEISGAKVVVPVFMLKKGSRGEAVRKLQEELNALGYSCGTADGIFGEKTETMVKRFQQDHGLTVDGIAGEVTQRKLEELLSGPAETPQSVSVPQVDTQPIPAEKPAESEINPVLVKLDSETAFQLYLALKDLFGGETVG